MTHILDVGVRPEFLMMELAPIAGLRRASGRLLCNLPRRAVRALEREAGARAREDGVRGTSSDEKCIISAGWIRCAGGGCWKTSPRARTWTPIVHGRKHGCPRLPPRVFSPNMWGHPDGKPSRTGLAFWDMAYASAGRGALGQRRAVPGRFSVAVRSITVARWMNMKSAAGGKSACKSSRSCFCCPFASSQKDRGLSPPSKKSSGKRLERIARKDLSKCPVENGAFCVQHRSRR